MFVEQVIFVSFSSFVFWVSVTVVIFSSSVFCMSVTVDNYNMEMLEWREGKFIVARRIPWQNLRRPTNLDKFR